MVDTVLQISEPFALFHDIDGMPLEDGYIYIGESGLDPISNPINVFSDSGLTLSVAQPVRTTGGYPVSAGTPIKLFSIPGDYSITVLNKRGTLIYTALTAAYNSLNPGASFASLEAFRQSSYSGATATIEAANEGTRSGRMILYATGTTGGLPTTTLARFTALSGGEIINEGGFGYALAQDQEITPFLFGAAGDGVSDDTVALQLADAAVDSGTVHFPRGIYRFTTTLNKNPRNTWRGDGSCNLTFIDADWFGSLLFGDFDGQFISVVGNGINRMDGAFIDLVITGPSDRSHVASVGVSLENVSYQLFKSVYIHLTGSHCVYATSTGGICNQIKFIECSIAADISGVGVFLDDVDDCWFEYTELAGVDYSVHLDTCAFIMFDNCRIQFTPGTGLYIQNCSHVSVDSGIIDLCDVDGILIQNSSDINISAPTFRSIEGNLIHLFATTAEVVSRVQINGISAAVGVVANTDGIEFDNDGAAGTIASINVIGNDFSQCTNALVNPDQCQGPLVYDDNTQQPGLLLPVVGSFSHNITQGNVIKVNGSIASDMTITLSRYPTRNGFRLRVVRIGGGGANLLINNYDATLLDTLATAGTWADFVQQGNGTWFLIGSGII